MKNLKRYLEALNQIEQSSSSSLVRKTLRQRRMDLIQTKESLNAILEHVNYESVQGMRTFRDYLVTKDYKMHA